jgi:hypothetical protein
MTNVLMENPRLVLIPRKARVCGFRRTLTRGLALSVAVLLALFVIQIASHVHANDQNQSACNRCQVAHLGLALIKNNTLLRAPLLGVGRISTFILIFHQVLFLQFSSSRAPPSA